MKRLSKTPHNFVLRYIKFLKAMHVDYFVMSERYDVSKNMAVRIYTPTHKTMFLLNNWSNIVVVWRSTLVVAPSHPHIGVGYYPNAGGDMCFAPVVEGHPSDPREFVCDKPFVYEGHVSCKLPNGVGETAVQ